MAAGGVERGRELLAKAGDPSAIQELLGDDVETFAQRREGEKWRGPSGRWFVLKGGRSVPTSAPDQSAPATKSKPAASPAAASSARTSTPVVVPSGKAPDPRQQPQQVDARKTSSPASPPSFVAEVKPDVRTWVEGQIKKTKGIPDALKAQYAEDLAHAAAAMPDKARTRMMGVLNSVTERVLDEETFMEVDKVTSGVYFHKDPKALQKEYKSFDKRGSSAGVVGFFAGRSKQVHIDGGPDPRGTYVHELWHTLDANHRLTDSEEWHDAFGSEILSPDSPHDLGAYARTAPEEGFAELGRLIAVEGLDSVKYKYPKCVEFLAKQGLI
jgi:hypothetical protein